ncbi:MAG: DMT family transporter [Bacteroidales bacterium]|nr:DMT family transporter [Bacteroidales bacterium]
MQKDRTIYYHILACGVVIIWGTTFVSTKVLINNGLQPHDIFFYRFLLAYIAILPFSLMRRKRQSQERLQFPEQSRLQFFAKSLKDELLLVLLGVSGGSLYYLLENTAIEHTYAYNVALLLGITPLLASYAAHIFIKGERINSTYILYSLIALLGLVLVVFNGHFILKLSPVGDILALGSSVVWAIYTVVLRKIDGRYNIFFITRKVFFYGVLTILPFYLFKPLDHNIFSPVVLGNLIFLGLIASLLCYFLWNLTVSKLGAVSTANYLYIGPVITLITSAIILDEKITWVAIVGIVLILIGVYLAAKKMQYK